MPPSGKVTSTFYKYTVQPRGIGAWINKWLAIDPDRSTGVPLNPQFRNPPPGANDPNTYDDPVTVPAADLADNPYWKRDVRRGYARLSVVKPADVVGLLTVGSKAAPKEDVLLIGDAGQKQLVELKAGEKGLAAFFQGKDKAVADVLEAGGLPPMPTNMHPTTGNVGAKDYRLLAEAEQGYDTR
ncbi:21 kDa subunit of NADH dehydrogenase [Eremomyces bilateralis CBS 781.70]|uniref:21 kDa subunit of NADH dehydrogenase n=1 Tax=Eremomyces bilateralis CBS 781.70 TaxID=1392243 RepID=A0A6G1FX18_9PEZI|nr:21 kDa subunit of NADH dehydrogenase [Eremomyces bilateralis CBS 781.70]KAF1810288.1 21 kDa subunit of NADH dehydrogenase [Eremomyces bilateralis CBS 781.70]